MFQSTFLTFLKGEQEVNSFKTKTKGLLLNAEVVNQTFQKLAFENAEGSSIVGYAVVRIIDDEVSSFGVYMETERGRER